MSQTVRETAITLHGHELHSVFDLLGAKENSITFSLGWALSRSPALLNAISKQIGAGEDVFDQVRLQDFGEDGGYTDIELLGPGHHAIIEAKRGWWLPSTLQWNRYTPRFENEKRTWRAFIAMSDCTEEYASTRLPKYHDNITIRYFGWRDIEAMARRLGATHAEKRLLAELSIYLRGVATMQNLKSNMVYVVSLGSGVPEGGSLSWIEIVKDKGRYFHPVGNRWPKEPPNYVAFRYGGRLRSIHHIDSYVVSTNSGDMPGLPPWDWSGDRKNVGTGPHFLYTLGPAIEPPHTITNGNRIRQSARVWVMLDLLLTCDTITQAYLDTKARLGENHDDSENGNLASAGEEAALGGSR
jgi:hypothetical protein